MNTIHPLPTREPSEQMPPTRRATPTKPATATSDNVAFTLISAVVGAIVGLVILVGMGLTLMGQAGGLQALSTALLGEHSAWYLSRASAFVAYVLLWWSMITGLAITNRLARLWPGGPAAANLHEHASLLGVVFAVLHALVLLGDHYIGYTLPQILISFASVNYQLVWVGLGQIGLYVMALVTFTFYIRRWIGARTWRTIHYLSFAVFVLALLHGLFSGTDSSVPWIFWMYVTTGVSVVAMTVYRMIARHTTTPSRTTANSTIQAEASNRLDGVRPEVR